MTARPVRALVRVVQAPGLLLALWIGQLLFAWLLSSPVRAVTAAAMGPFTWFDDGHRLRALAELLIDDAAVAAVIASTLASSAMLAVAFAILVGPAVITRLRGSAPVAELGRASGQHLAAMIVQTLYNLVPRAVFGGLAAATLALAGPRTLPFALPFAVLFAALPTLVLDRARVAVVLEQDRPLHPKTQLRALVHVLRRPSWVLIGALLDSLQVAVGIAALVFVISPTGIAMGAGALWVARLTGLIAISFGLWRIALAVEDSSKPE